MGNCQCWETSLHEPTLRSKVATPDEFNINLMPPRLAKLADLAIQNKTETISIIDLTNRELGDEGIINLQNILQYYTHITALLLASTKINPDVWGSLTETLLDFSKLTELDLSHNIIGSKGAQKLAQAFERTMRLETLLLEDTKLESNDMIMLSGGLVYLRNLKVLCLGDNKIGDLGMKGLANAVSYFPRLVYFDIYHNEISIIGSVYIGKCLETLKNLQVFKVGSNFLIKEGGNNVVTRLPNSLKELWLDNTGIEDSHICLMAPLLVGFSELEVLILDHNNIGPKGAEVLTQCLPQMRLRNLSLIGCDVSLYRKALSVACENTEVLL
jgi:Ran GTPase-activating protein (RanGAP) involved in mRNA processing and transport